MFTHHIHLQATPIVVHSHQFQHIHVDLLGPLAVSAGFTHQFTMVDRTSRWVDAVPLSTTTAADWDGVLCVGMNLRVRRS